MYHPLISVIIPIYKVERYLPRCLDSILRQTYKELEIICVNDGSPDRCLQILESYAAKDPRIRVIDQINQGVSSARNNGLLAATGEMVAFIDSDDWIHAEYFELLANCMVHNGADAVFCEKTIVLSDIIPEQALTRTSFRKISIQEAFSLYTVRKFVWGRIYRREHLCGHEFSPEIRIGDDTMYNLDVLCHIEDPKLYYTRESLYYFFVRSDSITHTPTPGGVIGEAQWYSRHMDQVERTGAEWLLLEQAIKAALSTRYGEMFSQDAEMYQIETTKLLKQFIPHFWKSRYAPLWKKLILDVMYHAPWLYRAFRIVNDPTLLKWEKLQRKKTGKNEHRQQR